LSQSWGEEQVLAEDAQIVPAHQGRIPLAVTGEAARLADILPHLAIEARSISAQLPMGIHGRRRAGPGEEFWEFRPFVAGESTARIDWRRSARDDRLSVREREWESASAYWLWVDVSASMLFRSRLARAVKRDRALVLGLAMADMLVQSGERVGLLGAMPPVASRAIISRLAEAMLPRGSGVAPGLALPSHARLRRGDHVLLISDFIMPIAEFASHIKQMSQSGARGTILLIRDPAEESFPFTGEVEFTGVEGEARWKVGEAAEIATQYRARISAITQEMRRIALAHGFGFIAHVTDQSAAQCVLSFAALLGGQALSPPVRAQEEMA
jgi:uncharacterized protein (DUF58 family)